MNQHLAGDRRPALVAGAQRETGGEGGSRLHSGDDHALWVAVELASVIGGPLEHCDGVVGDGVAGAQRDRPQGVAKHAADELAVPVTDENKCGSGIVRRPGNVGAYPSFAPTQAQHRVRARPHR
jgi:hypothetical protein